MSKYKPYVLPAALLLGFLFHSWVGVLTPTMPFVVFTILLLNFAAVDLGSLGFHRLDMAIILFQTLASLGGYFALRAAGGELMGQAWLIGVLCPVAASAPVVCSALGADRRISTGYTIYGNLLVAVIAPIYFSFIGEQQDLPFLQSALSIFRRIASIIALPFFLALAMQRLAPRANAAIARFRGWALPLWAFALLVTVGKTIDNIFLFFHSNEHLIILLALLAAVLCAVQYGTGKLIGRHYRHTAAGGQLMGQKNIAMGVWMATNYLHPLTTVTLAFYTIFQNIFNSWQMWAYARRR